MGRELRLNPRRGYMQPLSQEDPEHLKPGRTAFCHRNTVTWVTELSLQGVRESPAGTGS